MLTIKYFNKIYMYNKNYKIAFLFLTLDNVNWPQFWNEYIEKNKDYLNVYVHPKYPNKITVPWMKKNIIHNLVNTGWGYIVEAYIQLFEEAMKDKSNKKFITVSESCIPIKSFDVLYNDLQKDNIKTSYIKFMKIKKYDYEERIKTQKNYKKIKFYKHLARFCLSRYHVQILLQKKEQLKFFYKMHVGDEFFLSLLYPFQYVKDTMFIYDNWEKVQQEIKKVNLKIKSYYEKIESNNLNNKEKLMNKIKECKEYKNKISANPYSYHKVYKKDVKEAIGSNSYFWRKFPKDSNIIDFYPIMN